MFRTEIKVRFNHVDVAGLVFYPRYYEMLNEVFEKWFEQSLGFDFRALSEEFAISVPAVQISTGFPKPSNLGETLTFALELEHLGTSSIGVSVVASCDGQDRLVAQATLVCVRFPIGDKLESQEIPPKLRTALARENP